MPTYRVTRCDLVEPNVYSVGIGAEYAHKFKYFETRVSSLSTNEADIVTLAWNALHESVSAWIGRVDAGNYLTGSTLTPADDGTLVFSSN
jgi:hypothetical protein